MIFTISETLLSSVEILIYLVNIGSCELMPTTGSLNFSVDLTYQNKTKV